MSYGLGMPFIERLWPRVVVCSLGILVAGWRASVALRGANLDLSHRQEWLVGWSFATGFLVAFAAVYKAVEVSEVDAIFGPLGILGFTLGGAVAGVLTALGTQPHSIRRLHRFATAGVVGLGFAATLTCVAYPSILITYYGSHALGSLLAPVSGELGWSIGRGMGGAFGGGAIGVVAVLALQLAKRSSIGAPHFSKRSE